MNIIKIVKDKINAILKLLGLGEGKKRESAPASAEQAPPVPDPGPESVAESKPKAVVDEPVPVIEDRPAKDEPAPVAEEQPVVVEPAPVAEEQPAVTEPAPAAPTDFKDTPEKKALDEQVLATLKEFQEKELAEGRKLMLVRYVQLFEKKNGIALKAAIKQASAKCGLPPSSTNAKVYLSEVPGVEVFDEGLITCVCLEGSLGEQAKSQLGEAVKEPAREEIKAPSLNSLLHDISKYASWDGPEAKKMLAAVKDQLKSFYPESVAQGISHEQKGRRLREILDKAFHAGASNRPFEPILEMLKASNLLNNNSEEKARKGYEKGVAANKKWAEAKALERKMKSGKTAKGKAPAAAQPAKDKAKASVLEVFDKMFDPAPASKPSATVSPIASIGNGNANALTALAPSDEWTVLIDETGKNYSSDASGKNRGRLVALFVPKERPLDDLPEEWHAVEQGHLDGPNGVLDVIKRIQTARSGLLGIPITALPYTTQEDQWFSCLEELLSLSLRLLPMEGATKLSLFVEQRGSVAGAMGTSMLEKTITDVLHRLAQVFPERAKKITVCGKIIAKKDHPWNGYVDAAAFTWGSSTIQFVLKETGWLESCFLDGDSASLMRRALDALRSEDVPDANDWRKLLALVDADNEASLVAALLTALGQEAKANVEIWKGFLDEVRNHLDSKAIRMDVLARQLGWLEKWAPDEAAMPPRMRLLWLVSRLATANHAGRTDMHEVDSFRKEFDELVARLYREDCPLCAHANLHLAVSYTNAFEFEKARALLLSMREWPVEGMGLRMKGRLLSSLGQHEAFLGNPVGALPLFDEAISLFRDLSEGSGLEIAQTGAYAATAAMDAKTPDADDRLAAYLWGGPFSEEKFAAEARRLAVSAEPVEKYAHHILLRRLVELPENHPARAAYLSEKARWAEPSVGHPWELIEFYRALLLPAGEERNARLEAACELALADDNGPTLQVIAAVISGSAFCDGGAADAAAYGDLVACCAEAVPELGEARLAALRGQLDPATRLAPLDLAKAVLPFNFR
ncbi:MAG: hypothetical protein ILM98_01660 [Kiritimatiellae bacterium]|nr:hypothetical protein [Kiritimatiellia bacterium]